jgi:hypothetical protein
MMTTSSAMRESLSGGSRLRRFLIIGAALGLAAGLAACSALRLVYNQGAQWAYWWLDGYAEFTDDQEPQVRQALDQWFSWHRRTQLADYAALLDQARAEVLQDTTAERVCSWVEPLLKRRDSALEAALPAIAAIAPTLRPEQLVHIERRLDKVRRELRDDYLQDDPGDRHKAAVKRTLERIETLYGRLERPQREAVARLVAQSPWKPERWLAQRERRSAETLTLLRTLARPDVGPGQAPALLRDWMARALDPVATDDESRRYHEAVDAFNCRFGAEVQNMTSASQRKAAAERIQGWRQDLIALVGNGNGR